VIAIVEDGSVVDVKADPDSPHTLGFMCGKPRAMVEITQDPERITQPLRRVGGPGEFEPVSWDEALDDIATRLRELVDRNGPSTFATHAGNPSAYDACGNVGLNGLREAIGSPWAYGINGDDGAAFVAAAGLQFGSTALLPRPDLWRTDFLLMIGANPWVSKGSVLSEPQIRKAMNSIVERGGRVVVVDPRRTETARNFEHIAIKPGTDPWLLAGMLKLIVEDGLADDGFIAAHTSGFDALRELLARVDLDQCADRCGIDVATIAETARAFAKAPTAATYGRTGSCQQLFGTLTNLLMNALNTVTGNLNREGGAMFGWGAIDFPKLAKSGGAAGYGDTRTRSLNYPMALGFLPTSSLWRDITEPGHDQIRALCMVAGNTVLTAAAGGDNLVRALESLDLFFSLDIYVNETNKYAHYILPSTTFYERPDLPLLGLALQIRPSLYATDAVAEPRGEAREEWRVLNDIAKRMGLGGAYPMAPLRWLAKLGIDIHPMTIYDLVIRTGPAGDLFGLRRKGWSLKKLRERAPHGVKLADHLPEQRLEKLLDTPDGKVSLVPPELSSEFERLLRHVEDPAFPLRTIGQRQLRSHNSWMHNSRRFVPDGHTPVALVNPSDADAAGATADGDMIEITSASGTITMPIELTDVVRPGVVAIPHGWGHDGGWSHANATNGVSSNVLASDAVDQIEPLAGMSVFNGIPIRIRAVSNDPSR
jgi:formate dehydrogenase